MSSTTRITLSHNTNSNGIQIHRQVYSLLSIESRFLVEDGERRSVGGHQKGAKGK